MICSNECASSTWRRCVIMLCWFPCKEIQLTKKINYEIYDKEFLAINNYIDGCWHLLQATQHTLQFILAYLKNSYVLKVIKQDEICFYCVLISSLFLALEVNKQN
jgi:hypothetical protein